MFPSQEAVRFKMSAGMVWLLRFLAVFFLGVVGLGVFALVTDPKSAQDGPVLLAMMLFPVGLGALCWRTAGRARDQIAVDETGLWRLPPKGNPVFIAWHDVGVVRADDTMQRLIVSDRACARTIRRSAHRTCDQGQTDRRAPILPNVDQQGHPPVRRRLLSRSGGIQF
jgi:hypothetical protein